MRCRHPYLYPGSHWGCINPNPLASDRNLLTVITFTNKTALPIAEYGNSPGCAQYFDHLKRFGINSSELVFNQLPVPLPVSCDQKFQMWYSHDLVDCTEGNNGVQTCADVYGTTEYTNDTQLLFYLKGNLHSDNKFTLNCYRSKVKISV